MSLAMEFHDRCEAAYKAGRPVVVPWDEAERVKWALFVLAQMLGAENDHMTACDRTMGATHPCTCGADKARALLKELQ